MFIQNCRRRLLRWFYFISVFLVLVIVQSFYGKKSVNLPLIATEGFSTVLDCAMYLYLHIKSPKEPHNGKLPKNGIYYEALRPVL